MDNPDSVLASSGGGSGGHKLRGGWGPLRLLPRVALPGIPVPRLPLPGIPGLRRAGARRGGSSAGDAAAAAPSGAAAAASLTLSSSDASCVPAGGNSMATTASLAAPAKAKPQLKPASDVFAGAVARALSQSTIHPLDTLKVRLQTRAPPPPPSAAAAAAAAATAGGGAAAPAAGVRGLSKFGQLVPPPGAARGPGASLAAMGAGLASLYKGVVGAASGAGIAIGAYFACYGAACNLLVAHTDLSPSAVAFVSGGAAAAGSSVVKVPLAVCIRSVQAGVYPNVFAAASAITGTAGARGLFTGFFPTLLEDVPDMAVKFAAYESMRQLHARMRDGRPASPQEDFAMGALAGALAAAATTPLDVIKTRMMCAAAQRPTMASAARDIMAAAGPRGFLAGIGTRALSNGINSAVFFCFFEAIRSSLQQHPLSGASVSAAVAGWAAAARERAAGIPRALSSLSLALPLLADGSHAASAGGRHLGWATAGAGGGLEWLAGGAAPAPRPSRQQQQLLSLALPAGGTAEQQQLLLLADASGPGLDAMYASSRGHLAGAHSDDDASELAAAAAAAAGQGREQRRAGGGGGYGGGVSLSLLARASPLRLDHHSQIAMAVAALKGVEAGALPLEDE